ncbi:hypothetical protein PJL15_00060 [Paenarthrobacter nitroguajacolicus]|nr:hypothetical protein [Paenarthrobacter nitroguajacolicus]
MNWAKPISVQVSDWRVQLSGSVATSLLASAACSTSSSDCLLRFWRTSPASFRTFRTLLRDSLCSSHAGKKVWSLVAAVFIACQSPLARCCSRAKAELIQSRPRAYGQLSRTSQSSFVSGDDIRILASPARSSAMCPKVSCSSLAGRSSYTSFSVTLMNSIMASAWRARAVSACCSSNCRVSPARCSTSCSACIRSCAAKAFAACFSWADLAASAILVWCLFVIVTTRSATPAASTALMAAPKTPLHSWSSQISSLFTFESYLQPVVML